MGKTDIKIRARHKQTEEFARDMRGNCPAAGRDYPEKYLPDDVLTRLKADETWQDDEKFEWGWHQVCAKTDSDGAIKIQVAGISHGQGYHSVKYWLPGSSTYRVEHV
jgi:hypothetical protein